jgi:hypothetical protein
MPVVFTEIGYLPRNRTTRTPQNNNGALDTAEQIMAFEGLINASDGKGDAFHAFHIWQWSMPGSSGSLWNIDPTLPADQPNNVPVGQFLRSYAQSASRPLAGDYNRDGWVDAADFVAWRDTLGQFVTNFGAADGSGNGRIDQADYDVWMANFGATDESGASLAAAAAPEPALSLCVIAAAAVVAVRRASRRSG